MYGSKLNNDGSFVDLIAKYARLEHEYKIAGGVGDTDFDANGLSVSAEVGKRFTNGNGAWFEPQVELSYGRVGQVNTMTKEDALLHQDALHSLVGRAGFAVGKNLAKEKGNMYARASYLYDFKGDTDMTVTKGVSRRFSDSIGGGWCEVGVGANVNLSKATHMYFDVEKTYGGKVATNWQWNAGLRYSF